MQFDVNTILGLIGQSLRDPEAMAKQILKLRAPHQVGWMVLAVVTIASVILISVERIVLGYPDMLNTFGGGPFVDTLFLGSMTVIFIFVLYYAGLAMGGTGTFGGTLLMMTWFQTIVLFLVAVQFLAVLVAPGVATFVSLIGFGLQIWCLLHFLNVLHGFNSLGRAFGLLALSIIGFVFGLSFILLIIGGAAIVGGPV